MQATWVYTTNTSCYARDGAVSWKNTCMYGKTDWWIKLQEQGGIPFHTTILALWILVILLKNAQAKMLQQQQLIDEGQNGQCYDNIHLTYGCETCTLQMRNGGRMYAAQMRALRQIELGIRLDRIGNVDLRELRQ